MAKLYFNYSAMNAGKTTQLLQSRHNYHERGMDTLLFLSTLDTRAGAGVVNSRIGLKAEAIPFDNKFDFFANVKGAVTGKPVHCVFVDEAQFLTKDQVRQLVHIVDKLNIPVLAYGLRSDFRGELFEGSHYLLAWADKLNEVKTICHCGSKATMNARINPQGKKIKEGPQIEIGGSERYQSFCRKHFWND